VSDFLLSMHTNFKNIDFPESGLAPTDRTEDGSGWNLHWKYENLLSGLNVVMAMPAKLQPGELVSRITFFAPVSLMFFFFLMFILTLLKNIEIHPMNYFFLAASFFAFHLLLAYTADLIDIHLAFLLSAGVSIFLVVSYLRLVVGPRFAFAEAGLLQFLYLVGFSYTFFLEGYSALCVTVASIVTLYIVMRLTAKIRWAELFAASRRARQIAPPPPLRAGEGSLV
ncbi:MAG: inner membrane CreD family protein, partial [Bryobacterales bacterium]|nr:inner membrane CreD family protein [Bryobacterales bacterium]